MKKYILLLIILFFSQAAFCVSHSDSPVIYENSKPIKSGTIKVYKMDMELTQKANISEIKIPDGKILLKTFDGTKSAVCDETVILNADDVRELCILNNYFSICCVYTHEEIEKFDIIKKFYCNQYLAIEINGVLTGTTFLMDFMANARVINFYYEFGKIINDEDTVELKNIATKKEFRGNGYGKKMLKYLADNYKQKYKKMLVGTTENNIPFYVKQGFDKYEKTIKNFFVENYDEEIWDGDLHCIDMYCYSKDLKK